VEQGRPGRCWPGQAGVGHGRGGVGQGGAGRAWSRRVQGQAWPGWHRPGRLGSGTAGTGPDMATARGAVGGSGGARRYTMRGRDAREREVRERKGGTEYTRLCSSDRHISQ
jgi:hypothetical protein